MKSLIWTAEPADRIAALRAVAEGRSDSLGPVDDFTARRILRVYDALSTGQQERFERLDLAAMRTAADRLGPSVVLARRSA